MSHPLLQRDTSPPGRRRFTTSVGGDEFFLRDHRVLGRPILPGAAYIEMARAALVRALDLDEQAGVRLHAVLWARPFGVEDHARDLHVDLRRERDGQTLWEVYSEDAAPAHEGAPRVIHCRGRAEAAANDAGDVPSLDIEALSRQCDREIDRSQVYERFRAAGLEYGPAHRGLVSVAAGSEIVVARIGLPECVRPTADRFVVHPAVLDAALQAAEALPGRGGHAPAVPFSAAEVTIAGRASQRMWAVARHAAPAGGTSAPQVNIDLCDERGVVAVSLKRYATRALTGRS